MMPSSILSILLNFYTAYKIESEKSSIYKFLVSIEQTFSFFLKMPQILIIPTVTPFVIVENKEKHQLELRVPMTALNILLTVACTNAGFFAGANLPMVAVMLVTAIEVLPLLLLYPLFMSCVS